MPQPDSIFDAGAALVLDFIAPAEEERSRLHRRASIPEPLVSWRKPCPPPLSANA